MTNSGFVRCIRNETFSGSEVFEQLQKFSRASALCRWYNGGAMNSGGKLFVSSPLRNTKSTIPVWQIRSETSEDL
jgi:hypothetical protein